MSDSHSHDFARRKSIKMNKIVSLAKPGVKFYIVVLAVINLLVFKSVLLGNGGIFTNQD